MLMDRMTGSRRPSPDMASLTDSQKENADSGVEPGFGNIAVLTTGNGGADGAVEAGVEVRLNVSVG